MPNGTRERYPSNTSPLTSSLVAPASSSKVVVVVVVAVAVGVFDDDEEEELEVVVDVVVDGGEEGISKTGWSSESCIGENCDMLFGSAV